MTTRLIPTTEADLDRSRTLGVPLNWLGEDAEIGTAYGHIDPTLMASAVTEYCDPLNGQIYGPEHVKHVWAVREFDDEQDEEFAEQWRWAGVTAETPEAFPLTVLDTDA